MFDIVRILRPPRVAQFSVDDLEPRPTVASAVGSTSADGLRPTRRPSPAGVIAFGALAFVGGSAATHSTGVDAQASPTPPTTTQPVETPGCDTTVESRGPVPSTDREPRRGRFDWIAV